MDESIIGKSEYSVVRVVETSKETFPVVEKQSFGIGKEFAIGEKKINEKIRGTVDPDGGQQYIVKYVGQSDEGGLLFERAKSNLQELPTISPNQFAQMLGQITQGIQFLDRYGISHRDLHRMENIFAFDDNLYKIGDFGLSTIVKRDVPTNNLQSFKSGVYSYIGEKILGLEDVVDSLVDVGELLLENETINPRIKKLLSDFLAIDSMDLKADDFTELATQLYSQDFRDWSSN